MKNGTAKKLICALIAAAILFAVLPTGLLFAGADSMGITAVTLDSTGCSAFDAFINDPRFTHGITWTASKDPELSPYSCGGCAAYCADFVKFCYGYNNPREGTAYYDINEARAGDIITIGNQSDGTGHWMVCLKRDGNKLYVAEANYLKKVRIGWNYSVSGGKLVGTSRKFNVGYHHNTEPFTFAAPSVSVSVGNNGEVRVSWNDTGASNFYVELFNVATQSTVAGTAAYVGRSFSANYQLKTEGRYKAYVTAIYDSSAQVRGGADFSVTAPAAPTAPVVSVSVGSGGELDVTWKDTGAASYSVCLLDAATQETVEGTAANVGRSFSRHYRVVVGGDYVACVTATYSTGESLQGTYAFSLATTPTAPVISVAIGDAGGIDVTWKNTGAARYYAYVYSSTTMGVVAGTGGYVEGLTAHYQLPSGGSYMVCVIAMYETGESMQNTYSFSLPDFHEHDYVLTYTVPPTCTAGGSRTYTCSICGEEYIEILPKLTRGDPDGDGEITVADALDALRIAAKLAEATPEMVAVCDTDDDGVITVADALNILRFAAKLILML